MALPRIGILGGMGPAATILLQQRLLDAVQASKDADHIPLLIDINTQVPSRIDYLIHGRGEDPGPVLAHMAKGLQDASVDALAMPCCTAHHFAGHIEAAVSVPFLNMVTLTAQRVANAVSPGAAIGILASPATENVGLFRDALTPVGLKTVYPKAAPPMLAAIEEIKSTGPGSEAIAAVQDAVLELAEKGVEGFIVGCSEFSMISRSLTSDLPIFDAIDVLTEAITDFWFERMQRGAGTV